MRRQLARLVPADDNAEENFVEIEGAPELAAEFVSGSSLEKDTRRQPEAYYAAGVQEYWLVDVREGIDFHIYVRGDDESEQVVPDADGFLYSPVLNRRYRLSRGQSPVGVWLYDLEEAEP